MKTLATTAALLVAFSLPAFAEADTIGSSEAQGQANGSFIASAQEEPAWVLPSTGTAQGAMAQGTLPRAKASRGKASTAGGEDTYLGFAVDSLKSPSGMDGGNRK